MDIKQHLDLTLPDAGWRCVGSLSNGRFQNFYGEDNAWAAKTIAAIDELGHDAYFAQSTFASPGSRTQENAAFMRSLWLDIDTRESKPAEKYADRKEAIIALADFCAFLRIPSPHVSSSGYGLHIWWVFDRDIPADQWKIAASLLKQACKKFSLAADPSRTSDSASVLRPVGTHNYKHDSKKQVKLVQVGTICSFEQIHQALLNYLGLDAVIEPYPTENLNADLIGAPREYAPSDAQLVIERCGVIGEVAQTRGCVEEPLWRAALGVLAVTTQGEEICHAVSAGHVDYSVGETTQKIAQVRKYPPTLCTSFSDYRPTTCEACPHRGRINSPVTLGTVNYLPVQEIPQYQQSSGDPFGDDEIAEGAEGSGRPTFPDGFGWGVHADSNSREVLWKKTYTKAGVDDSGKEQWSFVFKTISDVLFYPYARVRGPQKTFSMSIRMQDKNNGVRTFDIDHGMISDSGGGLMATLGRNEIGIAANAKADVQAYLNAWISKLRNDYTATPAIEQYGWHEDNFTIGSSYITPQGNRKAVLIQGASSRAKYLEPRGTLAAWVDAVDQAYNYSGQEALQFCVLASFAAPLIPLILPTGGVFVHAYSAGTGHGKSTASLVGLSAWGNKEELHLREGTAMATPNAMVNHFGVMKNLPVIIDEMTNSGNQVASELVYNTSAGTGKRRLNQDGTERTMLNWSTIVVGSSNNMLSEKLSLHRANASGELARLWEFYAPDNSTIPTFVANKLFPIFDDNYGHAGLAYAEYLVKNRDLVKNTLIQVREKFDRRTGIKQGERYWSALHACIITALGITRQLGLINFDHVALREWIIKELAVNRGQMVASVLTPLEQFGDMLAEMFNGILVTRGEGNLQQGSFAEVPENQHPRGMIVGRSILPTHHSAEKLYLSVAATKGWCNKHGVSYKEMFDDLVASGWASPDIRRISLGRGTEKYAGLGGPVKVWEINPSAVRAQMGDSQAAQKVQGVIQGGNSGRLTGTDDDHGD